MKVTKQQFEDYIQQNIDHLTQKHISVGRNSVTLYLSAGDERRAIRGVTSAGDESFEVIEWSLS